MWVTPPPPGLPEATLSDERSLGFSGLWLNMIIGTKVPKGASLGELGPGKRVGGLPLRGWASHNELGGDSGAGAGSASHFWGVVEV